MSDWLASFFRSCNARMLRNINPISGKAMKGIYAVSVWFYKKNFNPAKKRQVLLDNIDGDIKMIVDPSRRIGAALYWTGFHEFKELFFLKKFLRKDMVFIDVGANQGEYTLFAAKHCTEGRVLSFEPMPGVRAALEENVRLNKFANVTVFPLGLSDADGELPIYDVTGDNEGLGTLYPDKSIHARALNIPLTTLDGVLQEKGVKRVDIIKMDIEGGELKALHGSVNTIKTYKPHVLVEINESSYTLAGYTATTIQDLFSSWGYQAYALEKEGKLKKVDKLPSFGNILFSAK